jgi:cyclophilin family peptidyl-prolyl cis-trans isomerase
MCYVVDEPHIRDAPASIHVPNLLRRYVVMVSVPSFFLPLALCGPEHSRMSACTIARQLSFCHHGSWFRPRSDDWQGYPHFDRGPRVATVRNFGEKLMKSRHRLRRSPLGLIALEERLVLAAPVLDPIDAATLPAIKTLMIPLTASDADGDALTYTVSADNGEILAVIKTGQPFLKMSLEGYGDLVFQLFPDIAPTTVSKITGLVNDGFYDGLTIHRIEKDFVIQGGDPNGDGSGGPGFKFDDEFSLEAIFSGNAQLAMANSGKDTNGSQFFVTQTDTRFLDFNHTIYGQLVRGFDVLAQLNALPQPNVTTPPVTIVSMSLVENVTDAVLQLKASELGPGLDFETTSFTVTVTDSNGEFDTKTFTATSAADDRNSPPILGPVGNQVTLKEKPIDIALSSLDFENDPMIYEATIVDTPAAAAISVVGDVVTVTPATGFVGTFQLRVSVRQEGATNRGSTQDPRDYQTISVTVQEPFEFQTASVGGTEGVTLTDVLVSSFTPISPVPESVYTAEIAWGDGFTSQGIVTPNSSGGFDVTGTHAYARFGTYDIDVTFRDTFQAIYSIASSEATVTDAQILAEWVPPQISRELSKVSGPLAKVTDLNPSGVASDLSAVIAWGDGTTSPGIISVGDDGSFLVSGENIYARGSEFDIVVTVTSLGGKTAETTGHVVLNDPPVFAPIGDQAVDEGQALEFDVVAVDPNEEQTVRYQLFGPAPQFVSIDSNTGRIRVAASAAPGEYDVTVRAFDNGTPSAASGFLVVKITVRNVAPTISLDGDLPLSLETGKLMQMTGSIDDLPNSGPWNVQVDYGTGEGFVPVAYSSPKHFAIAKAYASVGTYAVRVRVTDARGSVAEIGSTVQVVEPPLSAPVSVEAARDRMGRITSLRLVFSQPLDAASAKLPTNYALSLRPGRDGIFGTADDARPVRFRRVVFDAATNSVTLTPSAPIVLRGASAARVRVTGLKDTRGRLFDGDRNGAAGGDLLVQLTAGSASFV